MLKDSNELLPVWREIGMGFFLYEWRSHEYRKKNFLTNHEWLSRRDEIKIPHARRSRKWGIFILSQLLSHDVMSEEIYPSLFLSRPGVTFPFLRGKFHHIVFACSIKICSIGTALLNSPSIKSNKKKVKKSGRLKLEQGILKHFASLTI